MKSGYAPADWPREGSAVVPMAGFFKVASSQSKPDANPAVRYRGYWFYLRNGDFASQRTFLALAGAYRFARPLSSESPVLTLPVGR